MLGLDVFKEGKMKQRYTVEQIIGKLRKAEVELGQGRNDLPPDQSGWQSFSWYGRLMEVDVKW